MEEELDGAEPWLAAEVQEEDVDGQGMWDGWPDLWVAHDQPERPLAYGAWLCDCDRCALALRVAAVHGPRLPIVSKTGSDRVVVAAEYPDQVWAAMGGLEPLCYVRRDYIREVFVGQWFWWNRTDRWWSLARSERVKSKRSGLAQATRSSSRVGGFAEVDNPRVLKHLVPGAVVEATASSTRASAPSRGSRQVAL